MAPHAARRSSPFAARSTTLALLACAHVAAAATAQPADLLRAQRTVAQVLVRDGAGATIASGSGVFLDIGKLAAPRALIASGNDARVVVGGKEQRVPAVLAEDRAADVVLLAVDLPDGAPPAARFAARPGTTREQAYAVGGGEPLAVTIDAPREVPGLGVVRPLQAGATLEPGAAVVDANGELLGVAIVLGDGKHGGLPHAVAYVVPVARLVGMRRVGPVPVLEWALHARAAAGPADVERAFAQGKVAALANRLDEAADAFASAASAAPADAEAWLALGACRRAQRDPDAAIDAWRRGVAAQPDNPRLHHELAIDLSDAGLVAESASEFAEVARLRPADAEARFNLGATLGALGKYDDEYRAYQATLSLDPAHVRAMRNLGVVCLTLKRTDEAVATFSRAGSLAPGDAEVQAGLGLAYLTARRFPEAIATLRRALQLAPTLVKAHFGLGAAYAASGDRAAAKAECEALKALDRQKGEQLCRIADGK